MPAHDAEAFVEEALRSALDQDYPADRLDVVVVDDGSTDATAAILARVAADHPGRVHLVSQDNRGLVGAVNAAAGHATGELLALLDADDVWPPDKVRRQVEVLQRRPEVGLVYTDMQVVDAAGRVLDASWLEGPPPPEGREIGRLLEQNWVTASSVMLRGSLRDELFPIPDGMPWADWYLGARTAQISQLAYLPEPRTSYRFHGNNMSLGSQGAVRVRELRKSLWLQRWFLRRLGTPETTPADLERAWDAFTTLASEALSEAGTPFLRLVEVTDEEREQARAMGLEARALLSAGDVHAALGAAVRAAATDPGGDEARAALLAVRSTLPDGAGQQPLRGTRPFVVCVAADEVVRDPALLAGCVEHLGDLDHVTLAVDASTADPQEAAQRIGELARAQGIEDDDTVDVVLVTGPLDELGRARLQHGTAARAGARGAEDGTPAYGADELTALRALALAARAQ
ncbi:glycosyltransferase [Baekduia soli]|uniref:Glycosyltransferase n=2 Tax=Baekduia soli TaxID=496014 RepID=A0A5B8U748_9ACTN|nr:glycosyltransferase [Baekduia soli]